MFYERVLISPASGKIGEVRALLEERVRGSQPRLRITLTERVLGKGRVFIVGTMHHSLEAYEKEREARRSSDSEFQAMVAKVDALVRQPVEQQLYDVVSSPPLGGASSRFTHMVHFNPASDKQAEMREALEEFVKARETEGSAPPAILQQLFDTEGPVFVAAFSYRNLTDYENLMRQRPGSIRNLTAKTNDMITAPRTHELYEVIVPFPQ